MVRWLLDDRDSLTMSTFAIAIDISAVGRLDVPFDRTFAARSEESNV
mgnify:CR=1 FL=1